MENVKTVLAKTVIVTIVIVAKKTASLQIEAML